jgi:hypothetical protein
MTDKEKLEIEIDLMKRLINFYQDYNPYSSPLEVMRDFQTQLIYEKDLT